MPGVAYQPRGLGKEYVDPLAQVDACRRDVKLMKELGLNVIRVYEVDIDKNHDQCMSLFSDAGIYLILDLATVKASINRDNPQWTLLLFDQYKRTIDVFSRYTNTLAFFAGNEVTNNKSNAQASPFVKAALRDIKMYIKDNVMKNGGRYVPVGYSSNDDPDIRVSLAEYFNCGNDDERADFFGMNLYEWCGESSFEQSGYAERTREFSSYSIPVILSEYGCNLVAPRPFTEVTAIYGPQMTSVWSGGIAYEWSQEINSYGLVVIDGQDGNVKKLQDFYNLKYQLEQATGNFNRFEKILNMDEYRPINIEPSKCPNNSDTWNASIILPQTPRREVCECMVSTLTCVTSSKIPNDRELMNKQFKMVCGLVDCANISADGRNGKYGNYSYCGPEDKLSYIFDAYYKAQNEHKEACEFKGAAKITTPTKSSLEECANKTRSGVASLVVEKAGGRIKKVQGLSILVWFIFSVWGYF
ncbi:17658_t:CDS:2 [Acaulospora morrowiae]|uniref:1,3-beta-glucanosyltransferase n=1 Tax=Acaulospora morrowiae TaxID=94023 RepID=A0A9N9FUN9_9GLOM|nr:17658_t:CDS:2 [Acaulospora morrowiae]